MEFRHAKKSALLSFIPVGIFYIFLALTLLYMIYPQIYILKNEVLITLTVFAFWRYGWMLLNYFRALIYRFYSYAGMLKQIEQIPEKLRYPKHLYFMIPSYKEEPWVSVEAFRSILNEIESIPCDVTIVVATSQKEEDSLIAQMFLAHKNEKNIDLIFQHQKKGKRIAMGHALRAISRKREKLGLNDPNGVTIFMDGDSCMEEGFLKKLLPFFALDKNLGAVTTNESVFIDSDSKWYKEWFKLKFGQRHIQFQSHSLSKKVMTLTGRLSAYRTDIVVKEDFIKMVENDILIHPLYGKFRFLMGDDKSTWFYLLKNRYNMLYLPDLVCYSLESRDGNFLELSRSLPFRWNGNTLRNNTRALALGAKTTGLYIWFVILDQRLNMWTSLVGIVSAIILAIFKSIYYLLFFIVWMLFVRVFQLFVIALGGHLVSLYSLPVMLYSQWIGALVKIDAYFDLANQKWSKNGQVQSSDANIDMIKHPLAKITPKIIKYNSILTFVFLMIISHGVFYMPKLNAFSQNGSKIVKHDDKSLTIDLSAYGVGVKNSKNNAKIINNIIKDFHGKSLVLNLPAGDIDIYEPIIINKSNITLQGKSSSSTRIVSHLKKPYKAAIEVSGEKNQKIGHIKEKIEKGSSIFKIDLEKNKIPSTYLLIRQPNDDKFLKKLGSKKWKKTYPYLRQQIVRVVSFDTVENLAYTHKPLLLDFDPKISEVYACNILSNIHLKDFKIIQNVPGEDIDKYAFVYKNRLLNFQIDAIKFEFVSHSGVENVKIFNSGKNALVFENCYGVLADHVRIDKAWNKGKGGNGYFRITRTYYSEVKNCNISNIRHLVLQWSSAGNYLHDLDMSVDLNFHGGFSHDNTIENISFTIPKRHLWKAIEHTPLDAKWAPPDGYNAINMKTIKIN